MSDLSLAWGLSYDNFVEEAWPLVTDHWGEVGSHRSVLKLNPDHNRYHALERVGALHIQTARLNGDLVGYMLILIAPHPRDCTAMAASDDAIYAMPERRKLMIGPKMIAESLRYIEWKAAQTGKLHIAMFREKVWRSGGGYLERYGFVPHEVVYAKVIKPHEIMP